MKKTLVYTFVVGVLLGALVACWGVVAFKGSAVKHPGEFRLSKRSDYATLLDSLKPRLRHHLAFDLYAKRLNLAENFKPGCYTLEQGMDVIEVVRMLKLGLQTPVRVTINNVKIPAQLAAKLARQIDADSLEIVGALTSKELAREVGFDSVTLFSMFLPDRGLGATDATRV